jgi:hypothetical protein
VQPAAKFSYLLTVTADYAGMREIPAEETSNSSDIERHRHSRELWKCVHKDACMMTAAAKRHKYPS